MRTIHAFKSLLLTSLLMFNISLAFSQAISGISNAQIGQQKNKLSIYIELKTPARDKLNCIEFFINPGGYWLKKTDTLDKYGQRKIDTTKCYTCKEILDNNFLIEIEEISQPANQPKNGCIMRYAFATDNGIISFKTKDLSTDFYVKIGYTFNQKEVWVEQVDPVAATEICPEQMVRWRMLRLMKMLLSLE